MKRRLRTFGIALAFAASFFMSVPATIHAQSAQNLTDEQKQRISTNCVSIKNSLSQLHASDALLRVNRGQMYESMATKLMDRFNTRLSGNNLDAKAMTGVTSSYRSTLASFRTHYISYEQKLSETMRIDCTKEPSAFHSAVLTTRELRTKVHEDVTKLHDLIDDYRSSVGDFLLNYKRVSE